jgi:hypothetical protein
MSDHQISGLYIYSMSPKIALLALCCLTSIFHNYKLKLMYMYYMWIVVKLPNLRHISHHKFCWLIDMGNLYVMKMKIIVRNKTQLVLYFNWIKNMAIKLIKNGYWNSSAIFLCVCVCQQIGPFMEICFGLVNHHPVW